VVGLAVAGGQSNFGLSDGLGTGTSDFLQVGAYGKTWIDTYYVSVAGSTGHYDLSTTRSIAVPSISDRFSASFAGVGVGARVEAGDRFAFAGFGWTPFVAFQTEAIRTPAYQETAALGNSAFALAYNAQTNTRARTELGGDIDGRIGAVFNGDVFWYARAAWAHEFDGDTSATAAFQSLPGIGFTVQGAATPADAALLRAGAEWRIANGTSVGARFEGEFANGSSVYTGMGTLRVNW
jgi:outer membrane autotransporter protein